MQSISSKDNNFVKHIRKLKEKKYRDLSNEYVIEGIKLVKEAITENAIIHQIIICEDCENTSQIPKELMYEIAKYECIYVTMNIFKTLTELVNPQGIMAVVEKQNKNLEIKYSEDIIVVLDDVQDPGNLGTILRTVDSLGLTQILLSKGTVDCYNSKVVRSTMGAIFRVKIIQCEDLKEVLKEIKKHKFQTIVTSLKAKKNIYEIDYNKKVIIIGNEANGVSNGIQENADESVKIPMLGKTESLNASVATGVILYEYVRQKVNKNI